MSLPIRMPRKPAAAVLRSACRAAAPGDRLVRMPAIPVTAGMAVFFRPGIGGKGAGEKLQSGIGGTPGPRGSARRGRWLARLVIRVATPVGFLAAHSGIARPDCRLRQLYLELATNAGRYGCHSGGLAQSSYRWLTTLQSTLSSNSYQDGAAVWRRVGFAVFRALRWGLTGSLVPCPRGRSLRRPAAG